MYNVLVCLSSKHSSCTCKEVCRTVPLGVFFNFFSETRQNVSMLHDYWDCGIVADGKCHFMAFSNKILHTVSRKIIRNGGGES